MKTFYIKRTARIFLLLLMIMIGSNARTQVGIGTTLPDAALEVKSADSGILVPRVALTSTAEVAPVINGTTSELVYNTAATGDLTPGYYYLSTATGPWVRLSTGADTASRWSLTGNNGTDPSTNFLGTTDEKDLVIKTNNTEQVRVNSAGNVGIGISTNPKANLELNGSFKLWHQPIGGVSPNNEVDNRTFKEVYLDVINPGDVRLPVSIGNAGRILYFTTLLNSVTISKNGSDPESSKIHYNGGAGLNTITLPTGLTTFVCNGTHWYAK